MPKVKIDPKVKVALEKFIKAKKPDINEFGQLLKTIILLPALVGLAVVMASHLYVLAPKGEETLDKLTTEMSKWINENIV